VNAVAIAPTSIILDTTASREVCSTDTLTTELRAYHGDGTFDSDGAPDHAAYAREQDAEVFASSHD
jgi:hypothetical protein